MLDCPNFECLDYDSEKCSKYPACDGCRKKNSCNVCRNQESLVEGHSLTCDMKDLPLPCRRCQLRIEPGFVPEDCTTCPVRTKQQLLSPTP